MRSKRILASLLIGLMVIGSFPALAESAPSATFNYTKAPETISFSGKVSIPAGEPATSEETGAGDDGEGGEGSQDPGQNDSGKLTRVVVAVLGTNISQRVSLKKDGSFSGMLSLPAGNYSGIGVRAGKTWLYKNTTAFTIEAIVVPEPEPPRAAEDPQGNGETPPGDTGDTQPGDTGDTQPGDTGDTQPGDTGDTQPGDTGDTQSGDTGDTQPGDTGDTQPGDTGETQPGDTGDTQPGDTGDTQPGDTGETQPGDTGDTQPGDTGDTQPGDTGDTQPGDTGETQPGDTGATQPGPDSKLNDTELADNLTEEDQALLQTLLPNLDEKSLASDAQFGVTLTATKGSLTVDAVPVGLDRIHITGKVKGVVPLGAKVILSLSGGPVTPAAQKVAVGTDGKFATDFTDLKVGTYTVTGDYLGDVVTESITINPPTIQLDTVVNNSVLVVGRTSPYLWVTVSTNYDGKDYSTRVFSNFRGAFYAALSKPQKSQNYVHVSVEYEGNRTVTAGTWVVKYQDMPTYHLLEVGSGRHDDVARLQERLQELGYDVDINGWYDGKTANAVAAFQRINRLDDDGVAGSATQTLLFSVTAREYTSQEVGTAGTLMEGDEGDEVRDLQQRLKKLNYYHGTVNGRYGKNTVNAVRAFERNNHLPPDGIADMRMQTVLYSTYARKAPASSSSSTGSGTKTTAPAATPVPIDNIRASYDARGNAISENVYDANGKLKVGASGYATLRRMFDLENHMIEETYFDTVGTPVLCVGGYQKLMREYDLTGNIARESYYDTFGLPVLNIFGYAAVTREYNEQKLVIREAFFDTVGLPVDNPDNYSMVERSYDDQGRLLREQRYTAMEMYTILGIDPNNPVPPPTPTPVPNVEG